MLQTCHKKKCVIAKRFSCEIPLRRKTIHISSKSLWLVADTFTHLPLSHYHWWCALSHVRFLARRWVRAFVWNINRPFASLFLCSRAGSWPRCLWFLFEAICWVQARGRLPGGCLVVGGGGPLSPKQASPKSNAALGSDAPDLRGDGASKLCQPARSLYTPQGPLICKRHCLPSDPQGAGWVFVTLLKGCFQCSLAAIYVRLCNTAGWSQRPLQKSPGFPLEKISFTWKGCFHSLEVKKNYNFSLISP